MTDLVVYATGIAAAEDHEARAAAGLRQAEARRGHIADRIADLVAKRTAIVARRAAGDPRADDGPTLALLDADREGLAALLAEADSVVAAARIPHDQARRAVAAAQAAMELFKHQVVENYLVEFLGALDTSMQRALAELDEVRGRLGRQGRPVWSASPAPYLKLRTLAAARGEL